MAQKKISQREARRLQQKVARLENQEVLRGRVWGGEYPNGVLISSMAIPDV